MQLQDDEDKLLRSVAMQNAKSILAARQRAEQELIRAKEALELKTKELAHSLSMLQERERELSLIYSNVSDIIFYMAVETDGRFRFLSVNKAFLSATGLSSSQVVGKLVQEVIPEPSCSMAVEHYRQAIRERRSTHWEETTEYPFGKKVGLVSISPVFDADGTCINLIGTVHDITRRKQDEERLHESATLLQFTLESARIGDWDLDLASGLARRSLRHDRAFGYDEPLAEWSYQTFLDHVHPDDRAEVDRKFGYAVAHSREWHFECRVIWPDRSVHWIEAHGNVYRADDEKPLRMLGIVNDITQRKQAEQALQDESRILELLNETGTSLASKLDLQSLVQAVTDAATQLSGAKFGAFFYNTTGEQGDAFMLYALSGAPREAFDKFGHPRATLLFGPTFKGDGPIRCDDVLKDPRYGKMEPHAGMPQGHLPVRSYLAVPVISRSGEVIGGLFFGHPETGVFTERTERIISGVAAQAAVAIDNARLYEAAQSAATEREMLLASERSARTEAERMSEMKDEFLATLSHELRTPLSAILGWSHILQRGTANETDLRKGLDVIERNARVQAQLIEDLLDMNRITSGKVRLDIQPVDPVSFIEAALETVRPAADAKGIRLEKLLDPAAGPISGDPSRLQQVIWNLLSNAIKFTPKEGKVQVLLERVNSHIEISVADTGIGIKPEFLPHVFERFRQADGSTTRRFGGLGLGLSIVKHLVELHGGTVRVKSPGEGGGTSFTVHLPLPVVHRSAYNETRLHPKTPKPAAVDFKPLDLSGIKVLVVDDETDARDLVRRVLAECDAQVLTAGTAAEALLLVEKEAPDVLVSDIGMPDVDGFELLRRVRALGQARGGKVPAIALTAFARSEDRTRALRAGFLVHVSKPIEPSELVATVASVAGRTGEQA